MCLMKELVVISGKGGTGKTSVVASFAALADNNALADCDVDAADLHLVLEPEIQHREDFSGGKKARILQDQCTSCGECESLCVFDAISHDADDKYEVDHIKCEGCGVCVHFCPSDAIEFKEAVNGEWYISRTRFGPMVHAKLGIAESNSGKLVSLVRSKAREIAERERLNLVIIDGSPGIGCPVIASLAGADVALIVTEPTISGLHDLERVCELTRHFRIRTVVCINKYDINEALTQEIEKKARRIDAPVIGKISYDPLVTQAQIMKKSVVECEGNGAAQQIKYLWKRVKSELSE